MTEEENKRAIKCKNCGKWFATLSHKSGKCYYCNTTTNPQSKLTRKATKPANIKMNDYIGLLNEINF